jgi:hypothetical protein
MAPGDSAKSASRQLATLRACRSLLFSREKYALLKARRRTSELRRFSSRVTGSWRRLENSSRAVAGQDSTDDTARGPVDLCTQAPGNEHGR